MAKSNLAPNQTTNRGVSRFFRFKNDFEKQIESEIMKSEKLRARFLCGVFLVLAILAGGLGLMGHQILVMVNLHKIDMTVVTLVLLAYSAYELGFSFVIRAFDKHALKFPIGPKLLNALVEISLASLGLLVLLYAFPAELALSTPVVFVYFLFIILSALRLDPGLAAFTGLVAALEFAALGIWGLSVNPAGAEPATGIAATILVPVTVAKAIIIVLAGMITAFVSHQIRDRMISNLRSREEQDRVRSIFGQQVSPAVMERLLRQGSGSDSESRHVCIMFLDIRNFTNFSQNRTPEVVVEYLNQLWEFMIEIINRNNGIINKFLGDGFMAVFGAPLPDGQSSANAVTAALEISDRLKQEMAAGRLIETGIGIGLHAGSAVTGNIGSLERREYTIIGDVVNLASRIEQLNKQHGSEILISEAVWQSLASQSGTRPGWPEIMGQAESLGLASVKGRDETVGIWRIR